MTYTCALHTASPDDESEIQSKKYLLYSILVLLLHLSSAYSSTQHPHKQARPPVPYYCPQTIVR
jgi:hypothetical protein